MKTILKDGTIVNGKNGNFKVTYGEIIDNKKKGWTESFKNISMDEWIKNAKNKIENNTQLVLANLKGEFFWRTHLLEFRKI